MNGFLDLQSAEKTKEGKPHLRYARVFLQQRMQVGNRQRGKSFSEKSLLWEKTGSSMKKKMGNVRRTKFMGKAGDGE